MKTVCVHVSLQPMLTLTLEATPPSAAVSGPRDARQISCVR